MLFKRITRAFLMGAGLSLAGVGCSAVDALVSSPAGHGASNTSPERMVAIGRVFENQGHLQRAQVMYRQALKADPGNSFARRRMDFIAGINSAPQLTPSVLQTKNAVAIADSIQPATRIVAVSGQMESEPTAPQESADTLQLDLENALDNSSVMSSLRPAEVKVTQEINEEIAEPLIQQVQAKTPQIIAADKVQTIDDFDVVDTGWEIAGLEDNRLEPDQLTTAEVENPFVDEQNPEPEVDTIAYDSGAIGQVTVASQWRPTRPAPVSLEDVAGWMNSPVENRDNLVRGLAHGADDGVKALAATLLAECPVADDEVNVMLIDAFSGDSELLRLAAGDALIQRGAITDYCVDELIGMLASPSAEIRIQAAASLRNCSDSEWAERCCDGLARMLDQDNADVVVVAASTLGDFGKDAERHIDSLQELSTNSNDLVAEASRTALSRINAVLNQGR